MVFELAVVFHNVLRLPHGFKTHGVTLLHKVKAKRAECSASQRSLHNAPIFRLLLKVAVNGTHQCDFLNFCGGFGSQRSSEAYGELALTAARLAH